MFRRILFLFALSISWSLMGVPQDAVAQSPVTLSADSARINILKHAAWLNDVQGKLTLADVQKHGEFVPLQRELSEGFTSAAVWLRFDVQGDDSSARSWVLEVANALLDDVRLYSPENDGSYREWRSGEDFPRAAWPVDYRSPAFPLRIESDTPQRFYLRISSRNALSTSVVLWQPDVFATATRDESFNYGVFYGIYLLILVFHLFFWIVTRETLGGWYVPYVLINFVGAILSTGHLQRLTGLSGSMSDMLLGVALCSPLVISNKFTLVQLELADVMPRFVRIFLPLTSAIGIALSLLVVAGYYGFAVGTAQLIMLPCIVLLVGIGISLAMKGHRPARFFLFAFGFFYAAVVIRFLRNLGILEPNLLTEYSVPIGALLHMVVMSLGITGQYNQIKREKLTAQAALNQSLETQVMERTASLVEEIKRRENSEAEVRKALDVMVRARQEQEDFVAMVSHEFRTPLAIINTVIQQLANNLSAPRERSLGRCNDIRHATRRMTDMMDEFLSLDRLGGEFHLHLSCFDPQDLVQSVVDDNGTDQLEIQNNITLDGMRGDFGLLRIALSNLVSNALRHSPSDVPIKLLAYGDDNGSLVFTVQDAGSGIPSDEIPRLFQKYFRGRSSANQPGAGLGLYLVDRIARLHSGTLTVSSIPGTGTSFTMTIPQAEVKFE